MLNYFYLSYIILTYLKVNCNLKSMILLVAVRNIQLLGNKLVNFIVLLRFFSNTTHQI